MFIDPPVRSRLSPVPTSAVVAAPCPAVPASRRLIWTGSAAAALFVTLTALLAAGIWPPGLDGALLEAVVAGRTPVMTQVAWVFTWVGSGPVLVAAAVVAAGVVWLRGRRPLPAAAVPLTLAATAGLVTVLKISLGRPRPPATLVLGDPAVSNAFPSGHTTNGAVVYVLGAVLIAATLAAPWARRALLAAGLGLAALIGWSRVYLGYHWVSDVAAGWLLATAIVMAAVTLLGWTADPTSRPARRPDRPDGGL